MKRALLAIAVIITLAACGGGGGGSGSDATGAESGSAIENGGGAGVETEGPPEVESGNGLPASFRDDYASVESCTNLRADEPNLVLEEPRACPTSGRMCCLPSVESFECGLLGLSTCGASGLYDESTRTIHLPDGCTGAFRHEAIHHLLYANGRSDWRDHGALEFLCQ